MPRPDDLTHPRDAILQTMDRIYRLRMTTTSGGNLSILDDDGSVWITPARVDKGGLRRDDIVRVRPDGSAEGLHQPSSELPFHRAIYQARPDLRAIVHAHPVALVAFSLCRRVPETRLLPATWRVCGEVGFAPYALPGSDALGRSIAGSFAAGHSCVVLENHGVVTAGSTLLEAFERFETLEFCAKTIIKASRLGTPRPLDFDAPSRPTPSAETTQERSRPANSAEKELRRQLAEFVRRAYQQRLVICTQGAFSARLDADRFVITPHRRDRGSLEPADLVLIDRGDPVGPGQPSSSAVRHAAIYARHPGIGSIINAYPVNGTAFSVTGLPLDTRTIPESYVVLREPLLADLDAQRSGPSSLAEKLGPRHPALILENDGVLVTGSSVLEAFDRLEVLEATSEALINALSLDPDSISPMSDQTVSDLRAAFRLP